MSAQVCLGEKFGLSLAELEDIIKEAKDKHLKVDGIHFHVGSPSYDIKGHAFGVHEALKAFHILERNGFHPSILDIGGGFPGIEYGSEGEATFEKVPRDNLLEIVTRLASRGKEGVRTNLSRSRLKAHSRDTQREYNYLLYFWIFV